MVRAAVAVLLTGEHEPSIVLMRRPIKKGDPWSGDMCLPGGRKDAARSKQFPDSSARNQGRGWARSGNQRALFG